MLVNLTSALPVSLVGRKAAALGKLVEAGFPVPSSLCITTEAFKAACAQPGTLRLPGGLLEALLQSLPEDVPLAVRSSAVVEDHPESSLAGRFETSLNVNGPEALEHAVLDCWRSYLEAPAGCEVGCMAVLVQPMLDAECAGVCFTVDPVRLRADLLLVVSAWGLGAGVVGGTIPTDTARLRRKDLGLEELTVANKHSAVKPVSSGGGVTTVSMEDELRLVPCLPEDWLERVGRFGLAIEQVFESPQDIEWAVAGGKIWILQSRPVTALPEETRQAAAFPISWSNEQEPRHYWWLNTEGDSPMTPAEVDINRLGSIGGQDAVYFGGGEYTRWIKYLHGWRYMAVARSTNSPGRARINRAAWQDLAERMVRENITPWETWGPEVELAASRLASFDAHGVDGPVLADHLEDAVAASTRGWMIHTLPFPRPIRSAALLDIYARLSGKPSEELAGDIPFLLAGAETIQTRLVESLYDLACLALESPDEAKQAALSWKAGVPRGSNKMTAFMDAFEDLMRIYGARVCYRSVPGHPGKLPFPWREAPEYIWEMIEAYLPLARQGEQSNPRQSRLAALEAAERHVEEICASAADPSLVGAFRQTLAYARRNARGLDEQNHTVDQVGPGGCFQALFHAGRWLVDRGCLDSLYDIFYLNVDEVLAALRAPVNLSETAAVRREEFARWQKLIPPACLGLPEASLPERSQADPPVAESPASLAETPGNSLAGEPASRGRAEGRARVVAVTEKIPEVVPGDVLVAVAVDLHWIPVLPVLAGLVLDYGSPGDHASITAREFGVPMVCNTLQATRRITEGAWVTVDAQTGLVSWT